MPREHLARKVVSWISESHQPFCSNAHATGILRTGGGLVNHCITTTTLQQCACHGNATHGRWSRGSLNRHTHYAAMRMSWEYSARNVVSHGSSELTKLLCSNAVAMGILRSNGGLAWIYKSPQPLCSNAHATGIPHGNWTTTTTLLQCACHGNTQHGRWSRGFLNYHNPSAAMRMPREYSH